MISQEISEQFTRYEIARIIGARALQIAMDAPILLKLSEQELKDMRYDALRIAEAELNGGVLPISIHRPQPRKGKDKLTKIKEEVVSDEELAEKEAEAEKEITEAAEEMGLVNQADSDETSDDTVAEEQ